MDILHTTPWGVTVGEGARTLTVQGESFARGHGSPDFVLFVDSIQAWRDGGKTYAIHEAERSQIVAFVLVALRGRGWSVETE